MEVVGLVLGGIAGLAAGIAAGLWVGGLIAGKAAGVYWLLNIVVLVAGVAAAFGSLVLGWLWLVAAVLGFEGGAFTGLKYGYGRSIGLWAVHDRTLGVDEELPRS